MSETDPCKALHSDPHLPLTNIGSSRSPRTLKRRKRSLEGQTLQDIPFKDLVEHGCADADAALRLYGRLRVLLKEKGIDNQFANEVMPLMRLLGEKELDGVRLNISSIVSTKDALADVAERAKVSIFAKAGKQFDVDSMKEIATVFLTIDSLRELIGRQPLRQGQLAVK